MGFISRKGTVPITGTSNGDIMTVVLGNDGGLDTYSQQMQVGYESNPYVFRAANLVASTIAGIRPILMDKDDNELSGGNHPLNELLIHPSPSTSWRNLMFDIVMDRMLNGNAYIHNITAGGRTKELDLYHGKHVTYTASADIRNPVQSWQVNLGDRVLRIDPKDMIHIHGFTGGNDVIGISPLEAARLSITQQNNARLWNTSLTRNNAKPSVVISSPKPMTDGLFKQFADRLRAGFSGSSNAGNVMVLDDGKTVQQLGFSPLDMDYNAGMTVAAREIVLAMGVPPELAGDSANKTYSNAQEANKELVDHTIKPMMDEIYDALTIAIVHNDPMVKRIGYDETPLSQMRGDLSTIITAVQTASFLTINEKRALLSYDSVEGGDIVLQPMGQVPVAELSSDIPAVIDNQQSEGSDNADI